MVDGSLLSKLIGAICASAETRRKLSSKLKLPVLSLFRFGVFWPILVRLSSRLILSCLKQHRVHCPHRFRLGLAFANTLWPCCQCPASIHYCQSFARLPLAPHQGSAHHCRPLRSCWLGAAIWTLSCLNKLCLLVRQVLHLHRLIFYRCRL